MKIVVAVVAVLLGLLSIAAGIAKIALLPDEVAFLSQFGLGTLLIAFFGTVQFLGGVFLVIPGTRSTGALVAALAFGLSAVLLFVAGNSAFAGVSLVPAILAALIAYRGLSTA